MAEQDLGGDQREPVSVRLLDPVDWRLARELRLAALADSPEFLLPWHLHESSWTEEHWRRSWDTGPWVVAEAGGSAVGVARLKRDREMPYVESVWTHPAHRRRGIASALIRELVFYERRERGTADLFVWVIVPNPAALELYASLGFEPTHQRQSLDHMGRDEERFRLSGGPRGN